MRDNALVSSLSGLLAPGPFDSVNWPLDTRTSLKTDYALRWVAEIMERVRIAHDAGGYPRAARIRAINATLLSVAQQFSPGDTLT